MRQDRIVRARCSVLGETILFTLTRLLLFPNSNYKKKDMAQVANLVTKGSRLAVNGNFNYKWFFKDFGNYTYSVLDSFMEEAMLYEGSLDRVDDLITPEDLRTLFKAFEQGLVDIFKAKKSILTDADVLKVLHELLTQWEFS